MINEHDIKDYNSDEYYQPEGSVAVKLYELPMLAFFKIVGEDSIYKFHRMDGLYGQVTGISEDVKNEGMHFFKAWMPVVKLLKKQDDSTKTKN